MSFFVHRINYSAYSIRSTAKNEIELSEKNVGVEQMLQHVAAKNNISLSSLQVVARHLI